MMVIPEAVMILVRMGLALLWDRNDPSALLAGTAYQPWYTIFLSQQNSTNRFISRRNHQPNMTASLWVSRTNQFRENILV
jgi:hypothetical protein